MIPWIAVIILVVTGHMFWALILSLLTLLLE